MCYNSSGECARPARYPQCVISNDVLARRQLVLECLLGTDCRVHLQSETAAEPFRPPAFPWAEGLQSAIAICNCRISAAIAENLGCNCRISAAIAESLGCNCRISAAIAGWPAAFVGGSAAIPDGKCTLQSPCPREVGSEWLGCNCRLQMHSAGPLPKGEECIVHTSWITLGCSGCLKLQMVELQLR